MANTHGNWVRMSLISLALLLTACGGSSGTPSNTATLTWDAPTTNVDETPLTDLAGYKIYYSTTPVITTQLPTGCSSGLLIPSTTSSPTVGTTVTATVPLPDPATPTTYYFAVTACNASGYESAFSNEVSKTISPPVDTTPPAVSSKTPANNATGLAVNSSTSVTFNEPMDSSIITTATFTIMPQKMKRG